MNKPVKYLLSVLSAVVSSRLSGTRGGNSWYYENFKDFAQDSDYLGRDPIRLIIGLISTS